jgi:hypothetical protein
MIIDASQNSACRKSLVSYQLLGESMNLMEW